MDRLIREQTDEITTLQNEFGTASGMLDTKYRELNQKFQEL